MRRASLFVIASVLLQLHTITPSKAGNDDVQLARVTAVAFQCSEFARLAEKKEEGKRLFNVAMRVGRQFVEAFTNGRISQEEVRAHVPLDIAFRLSGPSIDFILGRIYEHIGFYEQRQSFIEDPDNTDLRRIKAERKYDESKCVLIR